MTAAAARLYPAPGPVASPGRGATGGAGLQVVEGPDWSERLERAQAGRRVPVLPQETGDWLIWGAAAEGLGWPMLDGNPFLFTLANAGVLASVIVGQLAHREHVKRARIAARRRKEPSWAR